MSTLICPTCGCSLMRLGVTKDKATVYRFEGEERLFCCQGCLDLFVTDPAKYLGETGDLVVCPTCLAEKPRQWAVMLNVADEEIWFCRCPYGAEVFKRRPEYYLERLEGRIPNQGVLDHEV